MKLGAYSVSKLPAILRDLSIVIGVICLVYGGYVAWPPLGYLLAGGGLVAFGVFWEMDSQRKRNEQERNRRLGL